MRNGLVWLAAALLLAAASTAAAEDLTLEKAIELALQQNQSLKQANYQAEASNWTFARSLSGWLPHVTYDETWSRVDPSTYNQEKKAAKLQALPGSAPATVYQANLSKSINVAQPIFNGLGEWVAIDSAYINRSAAHWTDEDARLQTILNVKEAYFNALKTHALAEVSRESLTMSQEALRLYRGRYAVGQAMQSDMLRYEAKVAAAEGALIAADNNFALAKMALATLLGGPVEAEFTLPPIDLEVSAADLQNAETANLAGVKTPLPIRAHPAVKAADTANDLATQQLAGSVGKLLPRINFTYNYNWATDASVKPDGQTSWIMGVGVQIPLFQSGGAISGIGEQAKSQKATAEGVEQFERTFLQRAHTAQLNLASAQLRVVAARKEVVSAKADLDIIMRRAELGMQTILDVLDSQVAWLQSQSDLIGSVGDFRSAMAEWDYVSAKAKE